MDQNQVLVVGSSVVDLTFYTAKLPEVGETIEGRFVQGLGGKGFNQAVAARLSGSQTSFITAMGSDAFPPAFEAKLKALGIGFQSQKVVSQAATGAAAISVDEQGRNQIIVALGANDELSPEFLRSHASQFKDVRVLLLQMETSLASLETALDLVQTHSPSAITILNPAPARFKIPDAILKRVTVLTPNETELATLSGSPTRTPAEIKEACKRIAGPKWILATLGHQGCALFNPSTGQLSTFPAFKVDARDTSGAGDAFNGGLATSLARYGVDGFESAIRFASALAAISVTRPGTSASMPTLSEIESFLKLC